MAKNVMGIVYILSILQRFCLSLYEFETVLKEKIVDMKTVNESSI